MQKCDVLVVGGGPAGSACAWKLAQAGLDVLVVDKASFPRDKVCAGWITPAVVSALDLDLSEYARTRTLQPITGFRIGVMGGCDVEVRYDRPVSFGIRRCEFDHYLLQRSRARTSTGARVTSIHRDGARWIVNDAFEAPMLVGAGGHFCPVARMLGGESPAAPVVAAQEAEFSIDGSRPVAVQAEIPELYFCPDLKGYGWCFRKDAYLNIGLGTLDTHACQRALGEFISYLKSLGRIPDDASCRFRGHAYLLSDPPSRRSVDAGVLLAGDAVGLAYPQSGEGIRPAVESGLMAATTIIEARGQYSYERLKMYEASIRPRRRAAAATRLLSRLLPGAVALPLAHTLLRVPWFVRRVVIDRWFLRSTSADFRLHSQPLH